MKLLIGLLFSLNAFAMPTIGDYAKLSAMIGEEGSQEELSMEYEIVDFDHDDNRYLVNETTRFANQPASVKQNWMERDQLMSEQEVQDLLTNCKALGGTPEKVATILGKFETCKTKDQSTLSDINIGRVPFGIVKINNNGVEMIITAMKFGVK